MKTWLKESNLKAMMLLNRQTTQTLYWMNWQIVMHVTPEQVKKKLLVTDYIILFFCLLNFDFVKDLVVLILVFLFCLLFYFFLVCLFLLFFNETFNHFDFFN